MRRLWRWVVWVFLVINFLMLVIDGLGIILGEPLPMGRLIWCWACGVIFVVQWTAQEWSHDAAP